MQTKHPNTKTDVGIAAFISKWNVQFPFQPRRYSILPEFARPCFNSFTPEFLLDSNDTCCRIRDSWHISWTGLETNRNGIHILWSDYLIKNANGLNPGLKNMISVTGRFVVDVRFYDLATLSQPWLLYPGYAIFSVRFVDQTWYEWVSVIGYSTKQIQFMYDIWGFFFNFECRIPRHALSETGHLNAANKPVATCSLG